MRTLTETVYTAAELREHFPKAFERARERYAEDMEYRPAWYEETWDSLHALEKLSGIRLDTDSRGECVRVDGLGDAEGLTGPRAMAWMEHHVFGPLRIPWHGPKRWKVAKYGDAYRAGRVPPCPLTGYCADEDFLEALCKHVREGATLKDAFRWLPGVGEKLLEQEAEYQFGPEGFTETADANGWEFREDGTLVH